MCSNATGYFRHTGSDGTFKDSEEEPRDQDVGVVLVSKRDADRDQNEPMMHGENRNPNSLDHGDDTNTPNQGRDTQDCMYDISASCKIHTLEAPSRPTSSSRETTDKISPRRLSDQVSNVEDRGGGTELLAVETHGLFHFKDLGVVQSGFAMRTVGLSKQRFSPTGAYVWLTQGIAKSYRREKMVNTEIRKRAALLS